MRGLGITKEEASAAPRYAGIRQQSLEFFYVAGERL
jgi:hypothetical protein|tara:strand:+ start:235 stop:342 length:108 start_codon:yes stop_codon:yes gene_type:complete